MLRDSIEAAIFQIADEEKDTYDKVLADVSKKLQPDAVPCMPVVKTAMQQEAIRASATKKRVAENASRKGSNKTYNKNVAKEEVDFAVAKDTADAFKKKRVF